jgi:hypothetical protein
VPPEKFKDLIAQVFVNDVRMRVNTRLAWSNW